MATSALLLDKCPALAETAATIGDPQVRNRGTIGGSLAHADPAADYPAILLALDAEIHVKGKGGWRAVKASDFFQGLFTVDLRPDEIIAGVQVKPQRAAAYAKLHQRASHFAIVGVGAALEVSGGNDQRGARRPHRRQHARDAARQRRGGARGQAAVGRDDRRGRRGGRRRPRRPQRRHPRERRVPPPMIKVFTARP